jgi:hypothetical protein
VTDRSTSFVCLYVPSSCPRAVCPRKHAVSLFPLLSQAFQRRNSIQNKLSGKEPVPNMILFSRSSTPRFLFKGRKRGRGMWTGLSVAECFTLRWCSAARLPSPFVVCLEFLHTVTEMVGTNMSRGTWSNHQKFQMLNTQTQSSVLTEIWILAALKRPDRNKKCIHAYGTLQFHTTFGSRTRPLPGTQPTIPRAQPVYYTMEV